MLVFGLSVAFSVNVTMFSTLRFFEGFCLAGLALSLYVLSKYTALLFAFQLLYLLIHFLSFIVFIDIRVVRISGGDVGENIS